jgi:hypothetical protein
MAMVQTKELLIYAVYDGCKGDCLLLVNHSMVFDLSKAQLLTFVQKIGQGLAKKGRSLHNE